MTANLVVVMVNSTLTVQYGRLFNKYTTRICHIYLKSTFNFLHSFSKFKLAPHAMAIQFVELSSSDERFGCLGLVLFVIVRRSISRLFAFVSFRLHRHWLLFDSTRDE